MATVEKFDRMVCDLVGDVVTFTAETKIKGEWIAVAAKSFNYNDFTDSFPTGETIRAYGLRAWLADRTSQLRSSSKPAEILEAMESYFEKCLQAGQWKLERSASGPQIDRALVHMITTMKRISAVQAEAALKKLTKEDRETLKQRYAEQYKAAQQELKEAEQIDLDDLLGEAEMDLMQE